MGCSVKDCDRRVIAKGYCRLHYLRMWRTGRTDIVTNRGGGFSLNGDGYVTMNINGKTVYEHILLAEKALGKKLPYGAIVHHTGQKHDNEGFFKLVICPNQKYHLLLHKRMRDLGYENN